MKDVATTTQSGTAALGCPVEESSTRFRHGFRLLLATVREIFDESAYQRFLVRHGMPSGRAAYAAFLREQEAGKARHPKCC
jgi:hypothetical protein